MSGKRVVRAGCAHNTRHVETARPQGMAFDGLAAPTEFS